MNNIKTVEVIKALPGLEVGDTLTRKDGDSNFELNIETVTEDYSAVRHISISQSLLNKEEFKAIDWFTRRKSNKEHIKDLEDMVDYLQKELAFSNNKIDREDFWANKLKRIIGENIELKKELNTAKQSLDKLRYIDINSDITLNKITKRINEKIYEFETKYHEVENNFANGVYFGEAEQWADESMTVYYNMIDLLKKLKA